MTADKQQNFFTKPRKEYEVEAMVFMWLSVLYLWTVFWFTGLLGTIGVSFYWWYDKNGKKN